MTLKIFYALMLLSRMEMPSSLTINRQANGDIGPRVFCPNKTYFGKQNKECIQKVEECDLLVEVGGITYNIYTFEEVQSPYTITITTSDGSAPCVNNDTRPVFFHEPTRQNGWDPILGFPLSYRTLVERNGSKVQVTFASFWKGVFLKMYLCENQCFSVKFANERTYPLYTNNTDLDSEFGNQTWGPTLDPPVTLTTTSAVSTTETTTVTSTPETTTSITTTTTTTTATSPSTNQPSTLFTSTISSNTSAQTTTPRIAEPPNSDSLKSDNTDLYIIIAIICGVPIILLIIICICRYSRKKRKAVDIQQNDDKAQSGVHQTIKHLSINTNRRLSSSPSVLNANVEGDFDSIDAEEGVAGPSKMPDSQGSNGITNDRYDNLDKDVANSDNIERKTVSPAFCDPTDIHFSNESGDFSSAEDEIPIYTKVDKNAYSNVEFNEREDFI